MTENGIGEGQGAMEADRIEQEALEALRGDGNSGPLAPLDDVARRRFVDDVLAASASRITGRETRRGWHTGVAVAGTAILATAAVIAVVIAAGVNPSAEEPASAEAAGVLVEGGRVLLASGDAKAGGARASLGAGIASGTDLDAGSGEIWVGLPTGFTVALSSGTKVVVRQLDRKALVLELDGGRLLVAALPGRQGPRLEVVTRAGTVAVKGTVFGVDDRDGSVEVHVARGRVEIDRGVASRPLEIGPSERITLGEGLVRAAEPEEDARLLGHASAFGVLDPEARASVELRSVPSGAVVEVDGTRLGTTPLVAAVRAGHRRIGVALDGRPPVGEIVSLAPGVPLFRFYDLQAPPMDDVITGSDPGGEAMTEHRGRGRPARALTAQGLLIEAQDRRAVRDFKGAAGAYEQLLRQHPSSDEARAALVSLGQIEIDQLGRPARALRHFDAYLGAEGRAPLSAEALLGRARALGALGRRGEERVTLELFAERHPGAIQVPQVRRRLKELQSVENSNIDGQ